MTFGAITIYRGKITGGALFFSLFCGGFLLLCKAKTDRSLVAKEAVRLDWK